MEKEEQQRMLANKVILDYKSILMEALPNSFPGLSRQEISEAIDY